MSHSIRHLCPESHYSWNRLPAYQHNSKCSASDHSSVSGSHGTGTLRADINKQPPQIMKLCPLLFLNIYLFISTNHVSALYNRTELTITWYNSTEHSTEHTGEQMRKLDGKYYSFLQSFLCSFKASNVIPLYVWFLHYNGTYNVIVILWSKLTTITLTQHNSELTTVASPLDDLPGTVYTVCVWWCECNITLTVWER